MLGANDGTTLETALDHWLLRHLDLDDERIAQGLFQVLFQQFFRELEETGNDSTQNPTSPGQRHVQRHLHCG